MTNDDSIEAYEKKCLDLHEIFQKPFTVGEQMEATAHLAYKAEPFWRKLAMKYREVLEEIRNKAVTSDFWHPSIANKLDDLLALTKKDIEDL